MNPQLRKTWLAIALAAVAGYEGLSLHAYPDVIGVPTICYGETKGVNSGDIRTKAQCDEMLSARLVEFNAEINKCIRVELPETRRAAIVSLAYNIGSDQFCKSTVVRKLNAGDVSGACDAFLMWRFAKGIEWQGLINRRQKERALCRDGI